MAYAEKRGSGKFPWRARYKLPDGTLGSEPGFRTKKAAQEWGEDQEAAIRHGRWQDPRKARTPFGEWAAIWMEAQHVAPNTVAKRRSLLKTHLLPEWDHTPLCDITLFAAKTWASKQTCAQVTIGHALTLLSMILTGAADDGYILANPLYGRRRQSTRISHDASRHRREETEEVWAHPEHVHTLYQRLGGVAGLMVLTTAYTGLRWGELTGLHRDNALLAREDKDGRTTYSRRVLRIDPLVGSLHEVAVELTESELVEWRKREQARLAKAATKGRAARAKKDPTSRVELYLGPPKNRKSAREVDLPPFLAALWEEHLEAWKHQFVFSTPGGQWWRRGNFARAELRPAADGRTALPTTKGHPAREAWEPVLPGVTMRGLRHTHDTWMKEDRIDRALRFERMGWVVKDIEGVYEHVTPQMRRELVDAMEERWKRARRGILKVAR